MNLKTLHQQYKYEEICSCWEQYQSEHGVQVWSEWNYVYAMNALYKLKRYKACLELYRNFHTAYPQSKLINDRMGWAVYHVCLKGHDFKKGDNGRYLKQVDYILEHCEQDNYSPVGLIVMQTVQAILDGSLGGKIDYQRANDYLDCLELKNISRTARILKQDNGKTRELSSQQEQWYKYKCKILWQLHRYEECLACCDQALTMISKFHNNNDVWLRRFKIESLLSLERVTDAKAVFEQLLTGKFNSWIIYEIGYTIAIAENNKNDALKYIGSCALADNSHQMRVKFYSNSAEFLYQHGFERIGILQVHLVDLIRAENKWKAQKNQHTWKVTADIAELTKKTVLKELKKFWQTQRDKDKVFVEGTVKTVLSSGRSGFIVSDSGSDYFFSLSDVKTDRQQLKAGARVRFTIIKRLDRKKNCLSDNAVEITLLK